VGDEETEVVEDKETCDLETSDDDGNEEDQSQLEYQEDSPNGSDHEPSDYSSGSTNEKRARLYSEHITNIPSASPQKKRNRVQATSSIRNALEIAGELTSNPKGLLHYWNKGSKAQTKEYWDREIETRRAAEDDEAHSIAIKKFKSAANKREAAKLRKQRQRERVKDAEIKAGVRSPGGTKRKVNA
jgi:hypothetical protein